MKKSTLVRKFVILFKWD